VGPAIAARTAARASSTEASLAGAAATSALTG
jgi:hypothetical protein